MREKLEKIAVKLRPEDNVATAVRELESGMEIIDADDTIMLDAHIQAGHKFATRDIPREGDIVKYGQIIGAASAEIKKGNWVHTHNVAGRRGRGDIKTENGGQDT